MNKELKKTLIDSGFDVDSFTTTTPSFQILKGFDKGEYMISTDPEESALLLIQGYAKRKDNKGFGVDDWNIIVKRKLSNRYPNSNDYAYNLPPLSIVVGKSFKIIPEKEAILRIING